MRNTDQFPVYFKTLFWGIPPLIVGTNSSRETAQMHEIYSEIHKNMKLIFFPTFRFVFNDACVFVNPV